MARLIDDLLDVSRVAEGKIQLRRQPVQALLPGVPVLAEEAAAAGLAPAAAGLGERFWLVDPLDGTREFVQRNGEFTVNVALIEQGRPVLGVVLAPALGQLYAGAAGPLGRQFNWLSLLLFLPVLFYSALPFYRNAWASLRTRSISAGKVAPTTRPIWPVVFQGPADSLAMCSYNSGSPATELRRWAWKSSPPGLEVRQRRKAPLPW